MKKRREWTTSDYALHQILEGPGIPMHAIRRISVVGLGDVGLHMVLGLMLYGQDRIDELLLYELQEKNRERLQHELSQIYSINQDLPEIRMIDKESLFESDLFLFVAAGPIAAPGSEQGDVRMQQYQSNWKILESYARMASERNFSGILGVVSDPVDRLATTLVEQMHWDPRQVMGFGQGVMHARARYYGGDQVRIFGPHGALLFVANDPDNYDPVLSKALTEKTVKENLRIRALGYKPFLAPAYSSAAMSVVDMLKGKWHHSSQYLGSLHWGERYRFTARGLEIQAIEDPRLREDISRAYQRLKESYE